MKKLYQAITKEIGSGEEWIDYEGFDEPQARRIASRANYDRKYYRAVYEFDLPDYYEELDESEQCGFLCDYRIIAIEECVR